MGHGYKHGTSGGGGGGALNFDVVNGFNTPPSNPKENTLWVNTSVVITSWVFSATKPENPTQGMVWFHIGTSSSAEFNALKQNTIQVYPISASIYNNGEWSEKEVKIYKNGQFTGIVSWDGILYNKGDECTAVTGGWSLTGTGTKNTDSITLGEDPWRFDINSTAYTNLEIDLTGKKTLEAYFVEANAKAGGYVYLEVYQGENKVATKTVANLQQIANEWSTLDISALPAGKYVVKVRIYYNNSSVNILLKAIFNEVRCK
jgi:hypothetical protein